MIFVKNKNEANWTGHVICMHLETSAAKVKLRQVSLFKDIPADLRESKLTPSMSSPKKTNLSKVKTYRSKEELF